MLCLARRWLFGGFRLTTVTVLIAATKTFTKNGREAYTQLNGIKEIKWRKRALHETQLFYFEEILKTKKFK